LVVYEFSMGIETVLWFKVPGSGFRRQATDDRTQVERVNGLRYKPRRAKRSISVAPRSPKLATGPLFLTKSARLIVLDLAP